MNIEEKNMLDFLSAVQMGRIIFDLYVDKTSNKELKNMLKDSIRIIEEHEKKLKNNINENGFNSDVCLKLSQKIAIQTEKIKIQKKNDFYLCLEIIKSMTTAMTKALTFIYTNHEVLKENFIDNAKEVIRDYDDILIKYKDFAINLI